jgi:hypothetical protein
MDVWEGSETMQEREVNDKTIQPTMMHAQGYLCLASQPRKPEATLHPRKHYGTLTIFW